MARQMTLADKKRFIELELRERYMLKHLSIHLNAMDRGYTYEFHATGLDSDAPFDAYLLVRNSKQATVGRYIVELKNRTSEWDEFIYEAAKHKQLVKAAKQDGCDILYINFTPEMTYVFPICDMKLPKLQKMAMANETFAVNQRQRDKRVYLLDKKEAFTLFVKPFSEDEYQKTLTPKPSVLTREVVTRKTYSLF